MNNNLTDITLLIDRSGSMSDIRADMNGGIASFIKEQQAQPGEAKLTLVQFDTEYEVVHSAISIKDAPEYSLMPRGSTALLDSLGRSIAATGERLAAMPEADRPGLVVFMVVTDGQENASKEFKREQIKQMIETQTNQFNWQFIYLSADPNAFADAQSYGYAAGKTAFFDKSNVGETMSVATHTVTKLRKMNSIGGQCCYSRDSFSEEERAKMAK